MGAPRASRGEPGASAPPAAPGIAAMVAATLLWGGTFVAIRDSLSGLGPYSLVFGRFVVAGVALAGLAIARRARLTPKMLRAGAISGVLIGGCYLLQAIGLTRTSAGSSAFLTCAGSIFAGLVAWPLLGQRPSTPLFVGIALALAGSALLSLDGALRLGWGEAVTFLGALSFAAGVAWMGKLGADFDPLAIAAVQAGVIALLLLPAGPAALREFAALSPAGWGRFAYLAIAGSLIAPVLMLAAQRALPPGRVGLLLGLEPIFAVVLAATVGGERFLARWWVGAALILAAVVLVEWRALSSPRPATGRSAA